MTYEHSEHHQRRIDRAHRRLMATVRTLAMVRKLATPSLQLNVARQQVNVSGSGPFVERSYNSHERSLLRDDRTLPGSIGPCVQTC
jgi:hypothetical protein